jgi:hypothetical protein
VPPIEPMTVGNMRENGVRSLFVSCWNCHHRAVLSADHWPDDIPVPAFGPRMVCTARGIIGADARPAGEAGAGEPNRSAMALKPRSASRAALNGATEAIMLPHGFTISLLDDLVLRGLATTEKSAMRRMPGAAHPFPGRQRALMKRPCRRQVALCLKQDGEAAETVRRTAGRRGLRRRSKSAPPCQHAVHLPRIARARSRSGWAASRSPWAVSREARWLRYLAVLGCSGPSAFSEIASARSRSGRAEARSPWS